MDKKHREFAEWLVTEAMKWRRYNDGLDVLVAKIESYEFILKKFNEAFSGTDDMVLSENPPAESLHEMAKRMCDSYKHHCQSCPNNPFSGADFCVLQVFGFEDCGDIEAQIDCLRQWAAENPPKPVKTYRDDFFEKFPNAEKDENGYPPLWVTRVYGIKKLQEPVCAGFKAAWDKPLGYWEKP